MHIGNIRLLNVFEKGPVTVKMPIFNYKLHFNLIYVMALNKQRIYSTQGTLPVAVPPTKWDFAFGLASITNLLKT